MTTGAAEYGTLISSTDFVHNEAVPFHDRHYGCVLSNHSIAV